MLSRLLGILLRFRRHSAPRPDEGDASETPTEESTRPPEDPRKKLGARGERAAAAYLKKQGLKILKRNYLCRHGEIDIVALDGDAICFVEVKTRRPQPLLDPHRTVTAAKRRKVRAVARHYLRSKKLMDRVCRFDIASVICPEEGDPEVELIKHAF